MAKITTLGQLLGLVPGPVRGDPDPSRVACPQCGGRAWTRWAEAGVRAAEWCLTIVDGWPQLPGATFCCSGHRAPTDRSIDFCSGCGCGVTSHRSARRLDAPDADKAVR